MQHITRIETESGLIRRVRANNPSPLTGTGTNTYVLGRGSVSVVDPGPDLPSHLMEILNTLEPDEHISSILVTHSHLDHSALVPRLKKITGALVYAFGDSRAGRSPHLEGLSRLGGGEGVDTGFSPDHVIGDGIGPGGVLGGRGFRRRQDDGCRQGEESCLAHWGIQ